MVKVMAGCYYLDKNKRLIYVLGKSNIQMNGVLMWTIKCLTTEDSNWLREDIIEEMECLGLNIAPAIRLLYAAAKI